MSTNTKILLTPDDHDIESFDVRCDDTHIHFKKGLVKCTSDCVYLTPAEIEASLALNLGDKLTVLKDADVLHVRRDSRRPRFYVVLKPNVRIGSMYAAAITFNEMVEFAKTVGVKVPVQPGEVRMSNVTTSGVGVSFHQEAAVETPLSVRARVAALKFNDRDITHIEFCEVFLLPEVCIHAKPFMGVCNQSRILLRAEEIAALNEAVNGGKGRDVLAELWDSAETVQKARDEITEQYQGEIDRLTSALAEASEERDGASKRAEDLRRDAAGLNRALSRKHDEYLLMKAGREQDAVEASARVEQARDDGYRTGQRDKIKFNSEILRLTQEREVAYSSGKKFALSNLTGSEKSKICQEYLKEQAARIAVEIPRARGDHKSARVLALHAVEAILALPTLAQ